MPGKTNKAQSKRSPALTEANKRRQKAARERRASRRIGQAAQKRIERRAFLALKRKEDPNYARPLDRAYEVRHEALNQDSRGIDQKIYSCTIWYK